MLIYLVVLLYKTDFGMILYLLYLRHIFLLCVMSNHVNEGAGFSNNSKHHSFTFGHFSPPKSGFGLVVGHCVINHCQMCLCFCNALLGLVRSY